ncbi:MAG: thiamine-phosphate pyrophosphorylase [Planctomycetota bacterium]|nr:thiamine-phosphate pyrophosphorylase [Planctomycetota bacterium]
MLDAFTPGLVRALERAQARASLDRSATLEPIHLLGALADEEESRAATLLSRHGLAADALLAALGSEALGNDRLASGSTGDRLPQSVAVRSILLEAAAFARQADRSRPVTTEHLLAALLDADLPFRATFEKAGLRIEALLDELVEANDLSTDPLPFPSEIPPLEIFPATDAIDLGRVLDASANRAREGLRVVEDYVRFALDDPLLTRRLKDVRHRLDEAVRGLDADLLIGSRDTTGDVGTHIMTSSEQTRENPRAVVSANFKRTTEALRSLEEYTKLLDVWISGRFEVLRYDLYTLEKLTLTAMAAHRTFDAVQLYLLVGGLPTLGDLTSVVGEALAGGVQAVQLREKGLSDRVLLERAREVRILTAQARARFVLNDRPDLARLSGADAVHLGQEDMTSRDARRVLGPRSAIGISTHDLIQLERAVLDGASYLGVGPVFRSETKEFHDYAGLGFVRQAADSTTLPWFAIGGITQDNLDATIEAGARRIAVSSAIVRADRPREAASRFRKVLDSLD